jgi:ATP-dependent DNA ligase
LCCVCSGACSSCLGSPLSLSDPRRDRWLNEIKFDGYRVIARKDGKQVRLWARTTSDYSKAFTRIRAAVATLPVESVVLDGEAIVLRPDNTSDLEALRSRQGQTEGPMFPIHKLSHCLAAEVRMAVAPAKGALSSPKQPTGR